MSAAGFLESVGDTGPISKQHTVAVPVECYFVESVESASTDLLAYCAFKSPGRILETDVYCGQEPALMPCNQCVQ